MANYKIKDLQQAQTLNGAVALEIQDGDSTSTFATLDQIAEFLGNTTPVVLLTKAGPIDDSYLPDMSASEIAAAYDRIVADPIHTVPVVRIPDNGGQYLVPSGYGVHADTKAVIGYYASQTYVLPSSLTLTSETFTLSRLPYTASSMEWADLLNNTALPSGYLGIDSDSTSEEISAAVGGVDAFRKLCSKLLRRNCIVVVSTDPAAANRSASIPVIVDVNRSVGLPLKITLEIEYISSGEYIALTITESGGTFSAMRTSVSVSDIPDALAGKADLDPATGFVKSSQIAPLQGRQTGVKTGNGGFVSTDPALCLSTAKTLVVTFKCDGTPNSFLYFDHGGSNANLGVSIFIASNRLYCNIGPKTLVSFNPESGKLYQVVVSFDKNGTSAGYMNSVKDRETTDYSTITDPTHFCLGALSDGSGSFSGVILGARLFNYALTASEVATLWNGGEPERYMLPLSGEMRTGLVAEYIAAGLLADKWRDTSGAGLDLPYVPTATGGTAELSYQSVPNQGEIVIDSGIFFTDIAEGTANKRIDVPRGYVALAVAVYNYNASALTNVTVQNWTDERAFIYGATVYNARAVYSVSAAGNKSVYNGTGITIDPTVQYLKVMATGNTTSGGMRVRVICKYLGA
ncbi:LamG-like jellyroll fold domain-containing protein [Alistipes communis]|uniref:LamG-like jellyroll fold domain-containing protein n=1 Tax=Alistipes communis TaxID=2585118 RepID=UPI0020498957|nr:MAG TPA: Concanavalin A-like lectin/glucanase superfamily protein [Caudoviricetes sp.]